MSQDVAQTGPLRPFRILCPDAHHSSACVPASSTGGFWSWDSFGSAVSVAAGLVAVVAAVWAVARLTRKVWKRTIGSRAEQQRKVDSLFPGANHQYIESILGIATLVSSDEDGRQILRYRLRDCWVSVCLGSQTTEWISMTVTDRKFTCSTGRLTNGLMDIKLGRDTFATRDTATSGVNTIGNKEVRYEERIPGTTAWRSQEMLFAYTELGFGTLASGGTSDTPSVNRSETTINSFAISRPFGRVSADALLGRQEAAPVPLGRNRKGRQNVNPLALYRRSQTVKEMKALVRRSRQRMGDGGD